MHRIVILILAISLGAFGCSEGKEEVPGPYGGLDFERTGVEDLAKKDKELASFLNEHYDDDQLFADDDLRFSVEKGAVTVEGAVDSAEERRALRQWLVSVPGVMSVNDAQLTTSQ